MVNFLEFVNNNIETYIREKNHKMLTAFRNIKSEYLYEKEKSKLDDNELVKKLYNKRKDTAAIYENTNEDLWEAEHLEMVILYPFLTPEPSKDEVISYLKTLSIDKNMKNFKLFQDSCKENFGQKVDSTYISEYIKS